MTPSVTQSYAEFFILGLLRGPPFPDGRIEGDGRANDNIAGASDMAGERLRMSSFRVLSGLLQELDSSESA